MRSILGVVLATLSLLALVGAQGGVPLRTHSISMPYIGNEHLFSFYAFLFQLTRFIKTMNFKIAGLTLQATPSLTPIDISD